MQNITFKNISKIGQAVFENDRYIHVHDSEMTLRYDSNFIEFKQMPAIAEFDRAASYLKEYHVTRNQKHLKFYFPEQEKLTGELAHHLNELGYDIGILELYAIHPENFPRRYHSNSEIEVKEVTEKDLDLYMKLQYEQEAVNGVDFARQKIKVHHRNFASEKVKQILAYYQGKPAGSLDLIINQTTVEIDGFNVQENYQRKGIGSSMQQYVMDHYKDKLIILVADGEDTAREMYRKQNYNCLGYQYEAQKV